MKIILFLLLNFSLLNAGCLTVIKNMDRASMDSDYRKIAWYTYKHKKKLDYIQKSYAILEKIRNSNSTDMAAYGDSSDLIIAIPTVEAAMAESEALTAINALNINLLNLLIYKSIKTEIVDVYGITKTKKALFGK